MSHFDIPSWGEENETDKWASDLFVSSNVKYPKVPKKRKRNKYPQGFLKTHSSQVIEEIKDGSMLPLKHIKPKYPKNHSCDSKKLSSSKGKKKSTETSNAEKVNMYDSSTKIGKSIENSTVKVSLSDNSKMSPKKNKKKKSKLGDSKMKQKGLNGLKIVQNTLDVNLKSEIVTEQINQSMNESITNINFSQGNVNLKKITSKNKKRKKTTKNSPNVIEEIKTPDESSKLSNESGEVTRKKRKHLEDNVPSVKKEKKRRKMDSEYNCQIEGVDDNCDIQTPSCNPNEKSFISQSKETVLQEHCEVKKNDSYKGNGSDGTKKKKLTLREKMEEKLRGARFRFLNEQLYTSKSNDTKKFFMIDQDAFKAYHEGYKQQLMQWPVKPIDLIVKSLKKKPASYVIADFGCGDAQLAQSLPNKVHSFDHVALNNHVTVCDMAHTPLTKGSIDVVVFCLSLMGNNLSDYVCEANRVLKMGGLLKIAEVESRFDNVDKFIKLIGRFGFLCIRQDTSNDYFYLFDFRKEKNLKEGKVLPSIELRPCSYKKR